MGLQQKGIEILIKAKDEASGVFSSVQGKLAAIGAAIAAYFGVTAFIGAIKGAGELEAKLSEVKAVSGATAEEMVQLRKAAEDAGRTTQFSATEAADALGNLTRAGVSAKDSVTALPGVLSLAQAGGLELAHASEIVTKVVAGMGLAFTETGRVADVLAMGANASNTSVKGLAEALSYAAPVAKSVGLSLESTVAIIGKFADSGIDASRAGTALNAVLSQFSDPSSKFRQELALAGITTRDFEKAIHQLAAAGPAGQAAILAVGTEAGPALRALMNQGMPALDELKTKLMDATGSAAATAAVMSDNLPGAIKQLGTAWDSVKNALATPVLPVLKDGVSQLTTALREAVTNGTIGKFGDSLAAGFQAGLKWAREFINQVDFAALTQKMENWAQRASQTFAQVGEFASNTGNIVKTVYGVMSAGVNTVLSAIYTLGEGFAFVNSKLESGIAAMHAAIAKVTFGSISARFKESAEEMRIAAGASMAVSDAFAKKAAEAFDAAAKGAELARDGWTGLNETMSTADGQAQTNVKVIQSVATSLEAVGTAAEQVGEKAKTGAAAQQAAAEKAQAAVAKLREEYEAALAAGDVQLAVEKMRAMGTALLGAADNAKKAQEKLLDVQEAFSRLGVTSTATLNKVRDAAEADFRLIRDSGLATTSDVRNAFIDYATKAIAANDGVATEALKVEAAMHRVQIAADSTGKVIAKSMQDAEEAMRVLGVTSQKALDETASRYRSAYASMQSTGTATARELEEGFKAYARAAIAANDGVASEALKVEAAMRGLTIETDKTGRSIVKSMNDGRDSVRETTNAIDDQTSALERESAAIERANAAREKAAELERKRLNVDKDGFTLDKNGNRMTMSAPTRRSVYEDATSQGVDKATAQQLAERFIDERGFAQGWAGFKNIGLAIQDAINKALSDQAATSLRQVKPTAAPDTAASGNAAAATRTVNFNLSLNGVGYGSIATDSAGADSLSAFLQALELAKGRSA